ncbi:MAG: hypothetical protein A4E35_01278 [Methanoregula sp. PtaU1.Bin051]|nr:MAG: hypothetical protein A4E35_01278 [Methanoregula sp. PtaU1.Bin051]
MKEMTQTKIFHISMVLSFLFFIILTTGCSSQDIKFVDVKKFQDSNITYSNLSCKTEAKIATITKYFHSCSFDVNDKNADESSIIDIEYSYCQYDNNCFNEGSATIKNLKTGELRHFEFAFEDILVNRLSISKPTFNFKAIRTVYIERI